MTGGDSNREWKEWLDDWQLTIGQDGRMTPIVPARGIMSDQITQSIQCLTSQIKRSFTNFLLVVDS